MYGGRKSFASEVMGRGEDVKNMGKDNPQKGYSLTSAFHHF